MSEKTATVTPWNKGRRLPPEPLGSDEVRSLFKACSNHAPTGIRNRALLAVLYRGGLRVGETLALKPKDLDAVECSLRVLHGKGDKSRLVGLDEGAWAILGRWLDVRDQLGVNGHQQVFCTLKGNSLAASYVRSLLARLARKAGVEKRVHPHGLRHTHAFELANEGHPLHVIQNQLGHANASTTDKYLQHLAPLEVVRAIRVRVWEP